jgi:uncharacterized membrane protein YgcG
VRIHRLPVIAAIVLFAASFRAAKAAGATGNGDQQSRAGNRVAGKPRSDAAVLDGPDAPVPPAVITRDEAGRATVRAIRLTEPLHVDGKLDEAVYGSVPAISDFIQQVPKEGAPSSERTDVWVMFDRQNVYVAARCWDSAPPSQWVANEMRRDTSQLRQNDTFAVMFDTFHDRRNGFTFYTNPLGAIADFAATDEGNPNSDWNPVWEVRTGRFDGGWTVEMAIPFKSLRYNSGASQIWGIQFRRSIRRKNEWTYLTRVPASIGGPQGIFRISAAATLVGLELPPASRNVEFKPYGISRLTTDRTRTPPLVNDPDGNFGIDAKYGVTANLTADVTYNTDFAQVEIDEQQVNLTRFSLFFPEKREFFLEGRGVFEFGRGGQTGGIVGSGGSGGGSSGSGGSSSNSITPSLLYTRRIGLNRGRVVPIDVGGRLTGKVGRFGLGIMNIQAGKEAVSGTPATNFTVMRVKRDIMRRSSIGALFTNRSESNAAPGSNQVLGADAAFSFFENVSMGGYFARSQTAGLGGDETSYQARFDYGADRYGLRVEHLHVGDHFNPEVGFVPRTDFRRTFALARFSPRPPSIRSVRKFTWEGSLEYILNGAGVPETRSEVGRFNIEFENSDQLTAEAVSEYELLVRPFAIAPDVVIPVGGYHFSDAQVTYALGAQRRASGSLWLQRGHFYDGTITALGYSAARVSVTKHLSFEPSLSFNRIALPAGGFTTRLVRIRSDYAFSPRMFASALLQFSSRDNSFDTNLRFRWEYRPGSEFFAVYTDERDTSLRGLPLLKNRAFVIKINRLVRF